MSEFADYIKIIQTNHKALNFTVYKVEEPILESKYGSINLVKIVGGDKPLIVIPGYSTKSFITMTNKLLEGINSIKEYTIYIVCWGDRIKELSSNITKDKDSSEHYQLNEKFRAELAHIMDKILRNYFGDTNISILGKSAGGGVTLYIASINHNVKEIFLCAPATTTGGTLLEDRKDIRILLSWNKDDDIIPHTNSDDFIADFEKQDNDYYFYLYDTGGHELNVHFLSEIKSK